MHPSSLDNMQKCYQRFIAGSELESRPLVSVLDVGGADVNGTYRDLFRGPQYHYLAADLSPGSGVSIVLDDPYHLPVPDSSVDIVLSGQMFEHCEFFWLSFGEMVRVLAPGGCLFLIAPSAGPIHRYPVDCYRFYPDSYRALAKLANCTLVEAWLDERGPWNDLVGVFVRDRLPEKLPRASIEPSEVRSRSPACEALLGAVQQEFTARALIVIDGRRSFREVLNDFMNVERAATSSSLVLVSDLAHETADTGDGWRIVEFLRRNRSDLILYFSAGSLVVSNLDPENRRLWEHYNPLVAQMQRLQLLRDNVFRSVPRADVGDPSWAKFVARVKEGGRPS